MPHNTSTDYPTDRHPTTGIHVLIVGAGTAGVFAALECWRKGHEVRILEKAPQQYTTGDMFYIGPSAIKAFRHWSGMPEENDRISGDPLVQVSHISGKVLGPPRLAFAGGPPDAPTRIHQHLRPKFQNMLMGYLDKIGVQVEYNCHIDEYFEDTTTNKGGVILSDGQRIEADVVVAADGIGTKSHQVITDKPTPATSSGYSIFRTAYPIEHVPVEGHGVIDLWAGDGVHGISWRTEDTQVWAITHRDTGTADESWSASVDLETVLNFTAQIPDWPEERDAMIKATPEGRITDFKLVWRDPQPQWVSPGGRVVQIGDAAHTFLPSSGNGATQGLEDAVSLATCLQLGGQGNVPLALQVHNLLRRDRVSCAQLVGVLNQNLRNGVLSENPEANAKLRENNLYGRWIWGHDAEVYANEHYKVAADHLLDGSPFQNTNTPRNFAPRPWKITELIDNPKAIDLALEGDWS